jgi:hypothetical protein
MDSKTVTITTADNGFIVKTENTTSVFNEWLPMLEYMSLHLGRDPNYGVFFERKSGLKTRAE